MTDTRKPRRSPKEVLTTPKIEWKPVDRRDGSFTIRVGDRQHHFRLYAYTQTPCAVWTAEERWGDSWVRHANGREQTLDEAKAAAERWLDPHITVIP